MSVRQKKKKKKKKKNNNNNNNKNKSSVVQTSLAEGKRYFIIHLMAVTLP